MLQLAGYVEQFLAVFTMVLPIIGLSYWAFKTKYPVAFQLLAGVTLIIGFEWFDVFESNSALAVSLALIVFSIVMAITALFLMMKSKGDEA